MIFGLFRKKNVEPIKLYCQSCDRDLTGPKELVIAEGRKSVYCVGYAGAEYGSGGRCTDRAGIGGTDLRYIDRFDLSKWLEMERDKEGNIIMPTRDDSLSWTGKAEKYVRSAIASGVLVNFGRLEEQVAAQ